VAFLVGIGERAASNVTTNTQVIQLGLMCPQAQLDLAQALAPGELGEGHAQKLVEAGEAFDVALSLIRMHGASKGRERQVIHQLGEDESALMHGAAPAAETRSVAETQLKSVTPEKGRNSPRLQRLARGCADFPRT